MSTIHANTSLRHHVHLCCNSICLFPVYSREPRSLPHCDMLLVGVQVQLVFCCMHVVFSKKSPPVKLDVLLVALCLFGKKCSRQKKRVYDRGFFHILKSAKPLCQPTALFAREWSGRKVCISVLALPTSKAIGLSNLELVVQQIINRIFRLLNAAV